MSTSDQTSPLESLTKEEIAWLIKLMWASLQAPAWTYKSQKDLAKIGEAIASGKSLKDINDDLYNRIFPHLVTIATHLGIALKTSSPPEPATETVSASTLASGPTSVPTSVPASATSHLTSVASPSTKQASASSIVPIASEAPSVETLPIETSPSEITEQTP